MAADADYLRRMGLALLKHFDLSRTRGTLFGFVDISRGLALPHTLAPLGDDRQALSHALESWSPKLGGSPVTASALKGLEDRPELLAMLRNARSEARRTLLVLTLPPKETAGMSASPNKTADYFPILLGGRTFQNQTHKGLEFDEQVMQFLTTVCPAVTIDPSLACGRMRWGHGSSSSDLSDSGEMRPWGSLFF